MIRYNNQGSKLHVSPYCIMDLCTSGSRTSETEGQILPKFFTTFFRRFPKKIQHFLPKNCRLSLKISDDLSFFVINLFHVLVWSFSEGGPNPGQNPYFSTNSQCYHYSLCSRGGQTPLPTSMEGHGRICPPWIRHW